MPVCSLGNSCPRLAILLLVPRLIYDRHSFLSEFKWGINPFDGRLTSASSLNNYRPEVENPSENTLVNIKAFDFTVIKFDSISPDKSDLGYDALSSNT